MFYRINRKGNTYNKWMYEEIFGKGAIDEDLKRGLITRTANGRYKGLIDDPKCQLKSYSDFIKAGGGKLKDKEYYNIDELETMAVNIPLLLSSGLAKMNSKGIILEDITHKASHATHTPFLVTKGVISRKGNIYTAEVKEKLEMEFSISLDDYELKDGMYHMSYTNQLLDTMSFEFKELLGIPYILWNELYDRDIGIEITDNNFKDYALLQASGHIITRGNKFYIDRNELKVNNMLKFLGSFGVILKWEIT